MFFTYILISLSNNKLYIGHTNNHDDRLIRHNSSRNKYTKNKGPWKLIFSKKFRTRAEAMSLEKKLKSFKNKEYIMNWIQSNSC